MTGGRPLLPANPQDPSGQHHYHPLQQQLAASHDHSGAATASGGGDAGDAGDGGPGEGGKPGPSGKPQYAKRGKITIVACVPCRRRKTKCDGKRPLCSQCSSRDSQCHYDMTDDQRKLTFLRDNVEHLQEKSSNLEGLLHTVQTANEEEAAEIFRRLRSGTDVQHVAEQVHAGRLLSGVSRRDSEMSMQQQQGNDPEVSRARQYDRLMQQLVMSNVNDTNDVLRRIRKGDDVTAILDAISSGNLSPMRLVRSGPAKPPVTLEGDFSGQDQTFGIIKGSVMAHTHAAASMGREFDVSNMKRPWTDVTHDTDLVDYLQNLYFTWQHSFFQSFPEHLFRADHENGRTKYCSALLVNAICASGCLLADPNKLKERHKDAENLAERFYDAAVGLVDSAHGSSITVTTALYLISYFEGTRGRLSNLWMYSGRSSLMALDINLHLKRAYRDTSGTAEEHAERENERLARCHAFWGAFHVDQLTSFTLGRLPNLNSHGVTQESPPVDDEEDKKPWFDPELGVLPKRPGCRTSTFACCASLSRIVNGTLLMFFAPLVSLSGGLLIDEYQKYQDWYHTLPASLSNTEDAPPHVLCLHMYYWAAVLHLFRPFLKATINNSNVVPREICRSAANNISDLMSEHGRLYQLQGIYMFQVHCLLTACTIHVINVPSIQATRHFTAACNTFQALISRNEWARSSLRILRDLVEKWDLVIPLEAEEALCRDKYAEKLDVPRSSSSDLPLLQHATDPSAVFDVEPKGDLDRAARPGPYPRQHPGQGRGTPQTQIQAKRSSSASGAAKSAANMQAPGPQKRQRIMASIAPGDPGRSASHTGTADDNTAGPSPSAESFLYSPLAGQAAPMLTPVQKNHAAATASAGGRATRRLPTGRAPPTATGRAAAGPAEGNAAAVADMTGSSTLKGSGMAPPGLTVSDPATAVPGAAAPRTRRASKRDGSRAEGAADGAVTAAAAAAMENGVEGLSFGDDWRDPFMGFLGQGYQEE